MKIASLLKKRNPTNANAQELKKERTNTYEKERLEYIQGQINKIRNLVEDRQSQFVWQTVSEANRRKSTSRAKLKTTSQEEKLQSGKNISRCLCAWKLPKVTDKTIKKLSMANWTSKYTDVVLW